MSQNTDRSGPSFSANRGNRGLKREYVKSGKPYADYYTFPADEVSYMNNAEWHKSPGMKFFGNRLSAFFVPPTSGEYSFHIKGGSTLGLYMPTSGDPRDDHVSKEK